MFSPLKSGARPQCGSRRKDRHHLGTAVALLALATAGDIPLAVAQGGTGPVMLEEVLVTARRREESLQEIPVAVSALNENYLREQNITELNQIGTHVPSLRISEGGTSTNTPIITLRGQRPSTVTITEDPAVPTYFAEIVLTPTQGTNLGMYDLANVQVLKGPQGTLFGRNSTGGAILLTPQTPGNELAGYGEVRVGDYDLLQFEGAVDVPVSDSLRFRFAGRSLDRDGYQNNVFDAPVGGDEKYWDENSEGFRVTTAWDATDRLSNLLTVSYDRNKMLARMITPQAWNSDTQLGILYDFIWNGGLGIGGKSIDEALERQKRSSWTNGSADTRATEKVENWIVSNITEYELSSNYSIKNIIGYRNLDSTTSNDADGTSVPLFGSITSATEFYTTKPVLGGVNSSQYSEELQFLGNSFDNRLDWIAGVYWMRMEGSDVLWAVLPGIYPGWPGSGIPQIDAIANQGNVITSPNANADHEAWAVYGEGTWSFNERWSVTAGARQTWDHRKIEAMNYGFNQETLVVDCGMFDEDNNRLPFGPECVRSADHDFDKLTGRGSVNWTPQDDLLLYFSVASGYRTGGYNARATNNFTLQPFDDETVVSYEIGNKADWNLFDLSSFRTNLAIYYQDYDDIQKTVSQINTETGAFETVTINAAKAEIWGGEFDVTIAPTANLVINLGYAYVDAKYKDWPRLVESGEIVDFTRANFLYVPENSATGSVTYTLPLPGSWGEVSLNASGYWQDEMWTNDDPWRWPELGWSDENLQEALATAKTDSYYVWNFRVDWMGAMGSGFDVAAYINNAFDEDYITGGLSVPEDLGWIAATYGPPRTYGASLRYNF